MTGNEDSCVALAEDLIAAIDGLPAGPFGVMDVMNGRYPFPISLEAGENRTTEITPKIGAMSPDSFKAQEVVLSCERTPSALLVNEVLRDEPIVFVGNYIRK